MTSESYHSQLIDLDETVKDSNISTITHSYHPQFVGLSNDMQSDVGHDSVVPDAPIGGKVLEFIMVTNNTSAILPTPTSQQMKAMFPEALMRTSSPGGNS